PGELPAADGALRVENGQAALATSDGVTLSEWSSEAVPALRDRRLVAHDFKRLPRELLRAGAAPAEDTLIAAYLIEPGRSAYDLDDLAAEYGLELQPEPPAEEETAALVRHAETTRRLAELLVPRLS